jgi:hypothetical protein
MSPGARHGHGRAKRARLVHYPPRPLLVVPIAIKLALVSGPGMHGRAGTSSPAAGGILFFARPDAGGPAEVPRPVVRLERGGARRAAAQVSPDDLGYLVHDDSPIAVRRNQRQAVSESEIGRVVERISEPGRSDAGR